MNTPKYVMTISLQALDNLGINLYSNIPAVLSEVVANAYDADADVVEISIEDDKIIIQDDGNGMDINDINKRFLKVGYKKRDDGESGCVSSKYKRPVMGRKGIGKLSLFSIAENIEIYTSKNNEKNGFILNRENIRNAISSPTETLVSEVYNPTPIDVQNIDIPQGTKIIITKFDKNVNRAETYLRKRIARRFKVIGDSFKVKINNNLITIQDRDYFSKIQFLWLIGDEKDVYSDKFNNISQIKKLKGLVESKNLSEYPNFKISGWIGAVEKPSDLKDSDDDTNSNNKISIITRGKLAQEDVLKSLNESGVFINYLIGEIVADDLDADSQRDIATSSRQNIKEDDIRYKSLLSHLQPLIRDIKGVWTDMRLKLKKDQAISTIQHERPIIYEWFDSLSNDNKDKAKDLFAMIESFHFDENQEATNKKELYKQGIIAFEKLRFRDELSKLNRIQSINDLALTSIFTNINDIEANNYYDIASERVKIIQLFDKKLRENETEKIIQQYLFDNLWLLNPSWERATQGSELMEQRVATAFEGVETNLSQEEGRGRFDIKYRTSGGKHIIIELKRYSPTYRIDSFSLAKQASKYVSALEKCLDSIGEKNSHIEVIIVLGEHLTENAENVANRLKTEKARLIYYDELVQQSIMSYSSYLEKNKEIGKIRELINKI